MSIRGMDRRCFETMLIQEIEDHRIAFLVERLGVEKEFGFIGGIAKNEEILKRLEKELGVTVVKSKYDTQIAGVLGVALFAKAFMKRESKRQPKPYLRSPSL